MTPLAQLPKNACLELDLAGQVQGVGLRPMLYRLAKILALKGLIYNHEAGARSELDGPVEQLEIFCVEIQRHAKPPIIIRELRKKLIQPRGFDDLRVVFNPLAKATGIFVRSLSIPPDAATCEDCWRDFFDPQHRLFRYPFISCTACGPRWSILRQLPFERSGTTLEDFPLCSQCATDYENPADRRFHAQTLTCPECGPRLRLLTNSADSFEGNSSADTISAMRKLLLEGAVGLIKGIGGFQLIGSALETSVIARIRQLKSRPAQALAIMINNQKTLTEIGGTTTAWKTLTSSAAPIASLEGINLSTRDLLAPDLRELGVMAPTSGLHFLIGESLPALIVTSANRRGMPLPRDLSEISFEIGSDIDFILDHNRKISHGVDDSVVRGDLVLRKARGLTPQIWPRASGSETAPTLLALGTDMKNSAAIAYGDKVIELPYAGELGEVKGLDRQRHEIQSVLDLLHLRPVDTAVDIHPASLTNYLRPQGISNTQTVPHHLAHTYAATIESKADMILAFDGTGLNEKGELKGSEGFLLIDGEWVPRLSLQASPLVGGDASVRFPWRSAVTMLARKNFQFEKIQSLFPEVPQDHLTTLMKLGHSDSVSANCSSLGRWFDAAAAIIEFGSREATYEAQAPIRLENLAESLQHGEAVPNCIFDNGSVIELDGVALLIQLAEWRLQGQYPLGALAFLAHDQIARSYASAISRFNVRSVVGTGGVFQNQLFFACLKNHLETEGVFLKRPSVIPVNDQSIALGQLAYLDKWGTTCTNSV